MAEMFPSKAMVNNIKCQNWGRGHPELLQVQLASSWEKTKKVVWRTALEKMLTPVLHLTLPRETSMVVEFSYIRACVSNPINLCVL